MKNNIDVIIVGAGIAGITTAYYLQKKTFQASTIRYSIQGAL